ncbi:MAG: MotA/TolQ/ExbB proton channel family protein [Spirochaetaceae bacterium]|nr:MotA/TolQ/ExbB proton channel family protein [Spirochaetaceae bacterium]
MWPLLIFSIISLGIILERAVYYFLTRQDIHVFLQKFFNDDFSQNKIEQILKNLKLVKNNPYLLAPALCYLESFNCEKEIFEEKIFISGSKVIKENEARLAVLNTIAVISPLIGLFGTVAGMIEVFQKLADLGGRADVALLSGGIWVALLTTAFGLIVAIPALLAHHYFSRIVEQRADNLKILISSLDIRTKRIAGNALVK